MLSALLPLGLLRLQLRLISAWQRTKLSTSGLVQGIRSRLSRTSSPAPYIEAIGEGTQPDKDLMRFRAWVVINADGRVAYIDHYKSDGKFGVRPVNFSTGRHFPNRTQHWSNEVRLKIPEELALSIREFRAAEDLEIPALYRVN
jgi:hypothetical protein